MIYTMLTIAIIRAVEGAGNAPVPQAQQEGKPSVVAGAPAIGAVKLEATRLVTAVNQSELIESDTSIRRVSVGNPDMIEVVSQQQRVSGKCQGSGGDCVDRLDGGWEEAGQRGRDALGGQGGRRATPV